MLAITRTVLRTAVVLTMAVSASLATAEEDFTGVWEAFATINRSTSPITAEGRQLIEEFNAQHVNQVESGQFCVPPGLVHIMTSTVSYPVEMIHSDDRLTILTEYDMQVRRVFIDGREIQDNYPATRMGYSVGEWQGDELQVETALLSEWYTDRWPRSENQRVHETIRLIDMDQAEEEGAGFTGFVQPYGMSDDVLVFDYVVEDPTFWTEPQEVSTYYQRIPEDSFLEYDCPADLWRRALSGEIEWDIE